MRIQGMIKFKVYGCVCACFHFVITWGLLSWQASLLKLINKCFFVSLLILV